MSLILQCIALSVLTFLILPVVMVSMTNACESMEMPMFGSSLPIPLITCQ